MSLLLSERQRSQGLRQQRHRFDAHGDLTGSRAEQRTGHSDHIAEVEQVDQREDVVAQIVATEVELNAGPLIGEMAEHRPAVRTPGYESTSDSDHLALLHAFRQQS